ncbi:MAG TPA: hypothetical protein VFB21_21765 [Chthonomonadaceae bacterium]|nr:hypothetical protein [Chthonomonadaceae bacterium]
MADIKSANPARPAVSAHRGWIVIMWTLYLLSPTLCLIPLANRVNLFPAAMLLSFGSFVIAVWLVFQRSLTDMLNGGIKLTIDAAVTMALLFFLLRSGILTTALASLSR